MKKIVILGAGIYQVPLIKAAKKAGLYVIVVSIPGDYPGFALADKVYELNTTDYLAVCEMAKKEKIDAIVTTGTDVAVVTIGYVCEQLGLPGVRQKSAVQATNKAYMKEAFKKGNVTTAEFEIVTTKEEACQAAKRIGYPVMIKIVDRSGSRGITRVSDEAELQNAYEYGKTFTFASCMVVEKFIEGKEIGIDAFVQDGQIKMILPHDKLVYQTTRTGIPMGHICPMEMSKELEDKLIAETKKTIHAMELDNCAVNMDVLITKNEDVYVIEAAGRCGATGIPEVISGYFGVDYYDAIVKNALGITVDFPIDRKGKPTASALLFSDKTGVLKSISYREDMEDVEVQLDYENGTSVHAFENGTHRIGQAIFSGNTAQEVLEKIREFQRELKVVVE